MKKQLTRPPGVPPAGVEPFTLEHFDWWLESRGITLESGERVVLEEFQREILADLFGAFREIWVIIPEGNAKTTLMALVALYHSEFTPSPWVPIGAATRDQAEILFAQAAGFVERSPAMQIGFHVYEGYRRIICHTGGRGIRVYAADVKGGDGVIPTLALVDELHRHDDLRLYRLWKGKLGKRDGKIATISTAGEPGAPFEELREKIRNVALERVRTGTHGCHLRAVGKALVYHEWMVPKREQAEDLEVVKDANPLSMITVEYLEEKRDSETLDFGEDWLRLTCNIPNRSSLAAVPESDWDACETTDVIPEGEPVGVGADLAWLIDTSAIVPMWMPRADYRLLGDGEILTPPRDGTMLDVELVHQAFQRIHAVNPIMFVVMDTSNAKDVAQWLRDDLGVDVIDRSQKSQFQADDYDHWMQAIKPGNRWLRHSGAAEQRRHVLNAIARPLPGDRRRFDRPSTSRNTRANRQDRRVIDWLTAAAMVHGTMVDQIGEASVYEERGILVI